MHTRYEVGTHKKRFVTDSYEQAIDKLNEFMMCEPAYLLDRISNKMIAGNYFDVPRRV